ncbi:hypothetical protein V8E53_011355 [Lactarius tabidus]
MGKESMGKAVGQDGKGVHGEGGHGDGEGTNSNAGPYDGGHGDGEGTSPQQVLLEQQHANSNATISCVFMEKDSANSSMRLQYQNITCLPQYCGNSFEELHMQDYQQNQKTAGSNAFRQLVFSGMMQPSLAPSLFRQPQPQPAEQQLANPLFSSVSNTAANNANMGTGNAFSGLGQNPAQPMGGFSTFNQTSQQPAASVFGAFGQQQQPQQQQPQQQQQGASLFGSTGAFGSQIKPPGGFRTGSFGGAPNTGSTSLFGQTNTAQQPAALTCLFKQNQPTNNTFSGDAFGASTAAQKPSIFGQTTRQQPSADGSFGLFGSQQQQQQQNPQGQQGNTGAFGNQPVFGQMNTVQPQQGGLFGATQAQQPATGLFGGMGGGLFRNV